MQRPGGTLELAPGWKFQVKVLEQDSTIHAVNGLARIVQHDPENMYDARSADESRKACSLMPWPGIVGEIANTAGIQCASWSLRDSRLPQ